MSKKNKDLQIIVKEEQVKYQNKNVQGSTLWFGKNLVGSIVPNDKGGYIGFLTDDNNNIFKAKHFDECTEMILKEWNLRHT